MRTTAFASTSLSQVATALIFAFGQPGGSAFAQSRQVPAPPQNHPIVIHSATIHTVVAEAPIEGGFVVFEKGVITNVGAGAPPRIDGAKLIDASGMHVYPGLIAMDTVLGLSETQSLQETLDHTEHGRVTPEVRAAVAVNPDSDLLPVTRANGILTAVVLPRGGAVCGRGSAIRLDGWTWEAMAIEPDVGVVVNWPRTETVSAWWMEESEEEQRKNAEESLKALATVFDDAAAYIRAKDADPTLPTDLRYEAMRGAITGAKPVFIRASSAGQIESAVATAIRYYLRPVIVGGEQADQCTTLLKKHDVPVIIGGTHRLPMRRHDAYDQPFALPAKLHEAGVRFAIASNAEPAHERELNESAGLAVAFGLPGIEALRAVTLYPAQIAGLGASLGSIETGKVATLILTSGDPLEITTDTLVAFIDGRRLDLGNRQKSLYAKYREKYRQLGMLED